MTALKGEGQALGPARSTRHAATVIEVASRLGNPLSTTHTIAATIMGVGATRGTGYVRWNVAGNMITAWFLTIPATALTAFLAYQLIALAGFG